MRKTRNPLLETKMAMMSSLAAGKTAHGLTTPARRTMTMTTKRRYKRYVIQPARLPPPPHFLQQAQC